MFVQVCAGGWHSAALSISGDVYVWGWNNHGQLGLDPAEIGSVVNTPMLLDITKSNSDLQEASLNSLMSSFVDFKDVALGSRHSVLLDVDGDVWTFGWNKYGQCDPDLSHGDLKEQKETVVNWKPRKKDLKKNAKVMSVAAAPWTTICVVDDSEQR